MRDENILIALGHVQIAQHAVASAQNHVMSDNALDALAEKAMRAIREFRNALASKAGV